MNRRERLIMNGIGHCVEEGFSGVVSVATGSEVIFRKAYGYADMANQVPNVPDTRFATASAGKIFVAIAIMRLVERGELSLDDAIGGILDFELGEIDPGITVRQLLNHTSGIPDYFDESVMDDYAELWRDFPNYRIRSSRDLLPLFVRKPMMYPAGSRFQYNNAGYVVLGIVLEIKTGMPFDAYLKSVLFDTVGMESTGYYELDRLPAKCASAYILDEETDEYYTNIYSVDAKGSGAGGAFTTVGDLEALWRALAAGRLVSGRTLESMLSVQAEDDGDRYGYGVWFKSRRDRLVPYIQGCDPGISCVSSFDRTTDTTVTILSNKGDDVWSMEKRITEELERA